MNSITTHPTDKQHSLKVLHIVWVLGIGGIETMLVNIVNAQVKAGIEVGIMLVKNNLDDNLRKALNPEISIFCANKKGVKYNPFFFIDLNQIIYKFKPDVIHLHGSRIYGYILSARYQNRCIVTLHDMPYGKLPVKGIMKYLTRIIPFINTKHYGGNVGCLADLRRIYAISDAVRQSLKDNYGLESMVINNGIIPSNFKRRQLNSHDKKAFRILQISRLEAEKKGQDLLLQALTKLGEEYTIDFIGDGLSRNFLIELSKSLNINHRVNFLGKKSPQYIQEHLCEYDLLVQPSRYEGFGLTVAEGIAAGVPVLVSRGQGPSEIICNNKYGWTFTNGDYNNLAETIQYIHDHYNEAIDKSAQAYEHVMNEYNVDTTTRRYIHEYHRIITG